MPETPEDAALIPCPRCKSPRVDLGESTGHNYSVYGRWWYYVECRDCEYRINDREEFEYISGNALLIYPEKDCVAVWNAPSHAPTLATLTASLAEAEARAGRAEAALERMQEGRE